MNYFFTAQGILQTFEPFVGNNEVVTYPIRNEPSRISSYSSNTIDQLIQSINPIVGQINETAIDINQDRTDLQRALDTYNKISSNYDPVHCQVSEWSACSQPCGKGKQTRLVTQSPANGGNLCPVLDEQCNTQSCPIPIDCEVSSTWTSCSRICNPGDGSWKNNPGMQTRQIIKKPKHGGRACPETSRICNDRVCPTDCALSEWSRCSKPCNDGTGAGMQTRVVATQPKNGGKFCPTDNELSRACNTQMCSVDCIVSSWSACSKTCADSSGPGNQTRTIVRPSGYGGAPCPPASDMTRICNTEKCPPPIDCISSWSPCSKPCTNSSGTGTQNLIISRQSAHGGKACPTTTTQNCNTQSCPPPINCEVSGWSGCSAGCGGGTQYRYITRHPANGGSGCPSLTQSCNTQPCPQNCEVSGWSGCSAGCGGGAQYRYITRHPANGGSGCPHMSQSCNTHGCPPPPSNYTLYRHGNSGRCLDGNGSSIYFGPCNRGNDYMNWAKENGKDAGHFTLRHKQSGKCLDGNGSSWYFGPCAAGNNYQNFSRWGSLLKHDASGQCLDGNGDSLYYGPCQTGNSYQWFDQS